jgi:hypothetical protein
MLTTVKDTKRNSLKSLQEMAIYRHRLADSNTFKIVLAVIRSLVQIKN